MICHEPERNLKPRGSKGFRHGGPQRSQRLQRGGKGFHLRGSKGFHARGSLTVFAAMTFLLVASLLFAFLELGRSKQLLAHAELSTRLGVESVAAEYQRGLMDRYDLLGLDGAYGGENFSEEYVAGMLQERLEKNGDERGAARNILHLDPEKTEVLSYRLMTDGDGDTFLSCVADYMKENFPAIAADALYEKYVAEGELEREGESGDSVDDAKAAIEDARRQQEEERARQEAERGDSATGGEDGQGGDGQGGDAQDGTTQGDKSPGGDTSPDGDAQSGDATEAEPPAENPLDLVAAIRENGILGLVLENPGSLSTRTRGGEPGIEDRACEAGTGAGSGGGGQLDRLLALEYLDGRVTDYLAQDGGDHVLSYELEYMVCGKDGDADNLEGVVNRLLIVREAANAACIMGDSAMRAEAAALATALAGFTGNALIIDVVELGVIAAWAYVESILDVRALLSGKKVALAKRADQWKTQLGHLGEALSGGDKAGGSDDGMSYREYLKGFLFAEGKREFACRLMDVMEQNIRLSPESANFQMDHVICEMECAATYVAEPFFWRFVFSGNSSPGEMRYSCEERFSYYNREK